MGNQISKYSQLSSLVPDDFEWWGAATVLLGGQRMVLLDLSSSSSTAPQVQVDNVYCFTDRHDRFKCESSGGAW